MDFENKLIEFVLSLFDIGGLKFGDFKMKVGINSPVYFDLRVIVSHPHLMDVLSSLLTELISNCDLAYKHLCGVPYTALPMATLVSIKSSKPMLVRRKEGKDYGTRKMVEGQFDKGDECLIIEDVVTSGSSILDTVKDLKKEGLVVKDSVVVLDREQGGTKNLKEAGINMIVLLTLSKVLTILESNKKISNDTVQTVHNYISSTQIRADGSFQKEENGYEKNRLKISFRSRAVSAKNQLASKLFRIMEEKKSMLCVAADVTTSSELLKLATEVGPHICIFKTHFDAVTDFGLDTRENLVKLAREFNFLVMEDRKFSDIGNTVSLQYAQIYPWADLVTAHSVSGEGVLLGLKSSLNENLERGCFLVAELSCQGSLITKSYIEETLKMAEKHPDFVVGFVAQSPDVIKSPGFIQLTPGVKAEGSADNLCQSYNSPEFAVLQKGCDVAVVGRGITQSKDPAGSAKSYKDRLWSAYLERIKE